MKINNYTIPRECRHISVKAEDNVLTITFEPETEGDFHCPETDHVESIPSTGDLAIFWDDSEKKSAIIARMDGWSMDDSAEGRVLYEAANGIWYSNVMRFRSYEQYEMLTQA